MNIKKLLYAISTLALYTIISGCGISQILEPTQTISLTTYTVMASETPILTEPPGSSMVTVTSTLDPWRYCFATPISVLKEGLPNPPQAQEIIETVQKAEEVQIEAGRTLDPSKFSTVFINDPRFPVSPGTLDTVRRLSHNPTLQSAGWLDYKMAYFNWMREEKAPLLTKEALRTPEPTRSVPPDFVWCSPPMALNFVSLNIDGDIATVIIQNCGTYELTLVLVDSHWLIAAYKGLVRCQP